MTSDAGLYFKTKPKLNPIMKLSTARKKIISLAMSLFFVSGLWVNAYSQKVAIDFNDFHGYTKTQSYLKNVADKYPNITELVEIGRSNMDRHRESPGLRRRPRGSPDR